VDWVSVAALVIYGALLIAHFVSTRWIERRIQHGFDGKIENLKAELRQNEERLKHDLRTKEAEISALREGVLSGRANRQALLDKRRLEAVEKVWTAVIALGPAKALSATMSIINYDEVVKDPEKRQVIEHFLPRTDDHSKPIAMNEQPFVSQIAWAYFLAYLAIIRSACIRAELLRGGIEEPEELLDVKEIKEVLKAALPHQSQFIEKSKPEAFHGLLDELEQKLLTELTNMLEGRALDVAALTQAKHIIDASKKLNLEGAEVEAAHYRGADFLLHRRLPPWRTKRRSEPQPIQNGDSE
jgi:hypothetical protein